MSQPRNMTTSPWDAQEFSQHGCLAQLVGGPANGEVTQFYKGKRELEVMVMATKPEFTDHAIVPAVVEKLFGKQPTRETYRLEFFEFGEMQFAIGLWSKLPMLDAMLQLLADAREYRAVKSKRPKQTAQSISTSVKLTEMDKKILKSMINLVDQKTDSAAPKEDTGDGTFSTSA